MKKPVIHISNNIEKLITLLRDQIFLINSKPFEKKYVFLPQMSAKNFLMTHFVEDQKIDVVTGIEFQELGSGVQRLFHLHTKKKLLFPPLNLLSLEIEPLLKEDNPQFAAALASEFLKYGKFKGEPLKGWKKDLWQKTFKNWNAPYQLLETPLKKTKNSIQIHIFNFPFLPRLYHRFFAKLSAFHRVHFYQFSPCKEFWTDIPTDREKIHLIKKNPSVANYLEEGHSLLANFGKLGRETFKNFEEEDFFIDEHYTPITSKGALSQIQNGVLNFQNIQFQQDASIRLFSTSSILREVEVLYHTLIEMGTLPSNIQVFAPDISIYAPFIEYIFGSHDSPYDFSIRDLSSQPLIDSLFLLFNLGRFNPKNLFLLFSDPHFFKILPKELNKIRKWIQNGEVKWGVDNAHRCTLLPGYLESSESGTWEQAFSHLIDNLLFIPKKVSAWDFPYLDFSDAKLLGKVILLIRSLRKDCDFLESAQLTLCDWVEKIQTLFVTYFIVPDTEAKNYKFFQEKLQMLCNLHCANDALFSFSSVKRYLNSILKEKKGVRNSNQLESITFNSLKLGSILPSKVTVFLGMNEGIFPRSYIHSSLSLLSNQSDFSPIPPDEDRYLFLEALMSTQEAFLVFYQNINEEDGKEQNPSLIVQELGLKTELQPPYPFHHEYFAKENSSPQRYFEIAKQFYSPQTKRPFIPEFFHKQPLPKFSKELFVVDINHLSRFAKHPLRYYCNQVLNLYFPYEDKVDVEFQLTKLKQSYLYQETFDEADLRGHVPLGRFKEVACRHLKEGPFPENFDVDLQIENFHIIGTCQVPKKESKLSEYIKIYPLILALTSQKDALLRYLQYYQISLQTPSPFHPQFAEILLKKGVDDFEKKIVLKTNDPYLQTTLKDVNPETIYNTWASFLRATFKELL